MCFFFSLMPATMGAIIGFFIWFASTKTEGALKRFGQVLAIWVWVIAVLLPVGGAYVTLAELCPIEAMMDTMLSEASPQG